MSCILHEWPSCILHFARSPQQYVDNRAVVAGGIDPDTKHFKNRVYSDTSAGVLFGLNQLFHVFLSL
ncbi:hypothetical protein BLL42_21660 [Pseudomonas frederiksbergensis]|uniref:Uncharacterized protein n=1 Tax=Pseudomonas frederiksbergensis TaxID=104087 RepID=A0A1J0EPY0_9PSED|nr:hypothetical protein BLL42_21660 [Pseudomonas frederiksbergensis]